MEFCKTFRVCRICLEKKNEFYCIDMNVGEPSPKTKLKECVPEMNLDVDDNPTLCEDCYSDLISAYTFRSKCLDTETKLNEYLTNLDGVKINLVQEYDDLNNIKDDSDGKDDIKEEICEAKEMCKEEDSPKTSDADKYSCNICEDSFKLKADLVKHLYSHIKNSDNDQGIESSLWCDCCSLNFDTMTEMKKHLREKHAVNTNQTVKKVEGDPTTTKSEQAEIYLCSVCGLKYYKKFQLRAHMRKHDPNLPYKCDICKAEFRHKSSLKIHRRVHAADISDEQFLDRIFRCDICSQNFYDKSYLNKHLKIHGEKKLSCPDCNRAFNNKGDLGKHRRIHTGEKPYECKFCGMRFRVSASLIRHTRAHTGEKPYVCETCGKCFNQKYNLNSHMKMHSGLKPYVCDTCNKAFSHKSTLDGHILKLHSDGKRYKCETCYKCFSNEENLSLHKNTHQSEKT